MKVRELEEELNQKEAALKKLQGSAETKKEDLDILRQEIDYLHWKRVSYRTENGDTKDENHLANDLSFLNLPMTTF